MQEQTVSVHDQQSSWQVCCAAVCRHQHGLKVCNYHKTGERFGYANYIKLFFVYDHDCMYIIQDVACKQDKWEQRAFEKVLQPNSRIPDSSCLKQQMQKHEQHALFEVKHLLPDAHGRAHSWACQVRASSHVRA